MLSTAIVGLRHAVAHMCQTGDPWAKCGPRSLNFKPPPTQLFWNSSGLYLRIKANNFAILVILKKLFSFQAPFTAIIITSQRCWLHIKRS